MSALLNGRIHAKWCFPTDHDRFPYELPSVTSGNVGDDRLHVLQTHHLAHRSGM